MTFKEQGVIIKLSIGKGNQPLKIKNKKIQKKKEVFTMAEFDTLNMADFAADAAPAAAPAEGAKAKKNVVMKELQKTGVDALNSMSEAEKSTLGAKKDTLKFQGYAVLSSKKTDIKRRKNGEKQVEKNGEMVTVPNYENIYIPKSIGVAFVSTENIEVPVVDVSVTPSNVDVKNVEVGSRPVAAGQMFILTPVEALYFCSRSEYSNQFTTDAYGPGYMHLNCASFSINDAKGLPTPTFHLESGAARDMEIAVDKNVGTADAPQWVVGDDAEFQRFAPMLAPKTVTRASAPKVEKPADYKQVVTAAAIRNLLGR